MFFIVWRVKCERKFFQELLVESVKGKRSRLYALDFLSSLPILVLCVPGTYDDKFYDRNNSLYKAAFLTRCSPFTCRV